MILDELYESPQTCPECGGPAFSDLLLAEKKDACYHKVRSRYKVWPSAYASGALVQCRKKGAANWGNKSKNEDVEEATSSLSTSNSGTGEFRGVNIPSELKHPGWREPTWSFQEIAQKLGIPVPALNLLAFKTIGGFPEAVPGIASRYGSKKYYKQSEVKRWVNANNVREKIKQSVAEASPEATFNALKGLKSWQVVIMNNYYRGKYSDYSGRYYYVLASSPEEARQVVLDNADAILQDLLSMKSVNGKKILPRSSALRITADRIGEIRDGTEAGRMSTAGFKRMFGPQGPMMVKLTNGAIADVQGQEQGVAEGSKEKTPGIALSKAYKKDFDDKKPGQDRKETALTGAYSKTGKPGGELKKQGVAEGSEQMVGFHLDSERAYEAVMAKFGHVIDHDEDSGTMYVPERLWPTVEATAYDADGIGAQRDDELENPEHYGVDEGEKVGNMDAGKFDDAMARLKQLAGQGPRKTVWDPVKRVYKTVPVNPQPK